jgi:hypothetical protein
MSRHRRNNDIKVSLKKVGCKSMDWYQSSGAGHDQGAGFCKAGNETSDFIKGGECPD